MKPRQIKKNSKSAMKLLIALFPKRYAKQNFSLEEQWTNKDKYYRKKDYFEWHFWGEPDYEYGECDSQVANYELHDFISFKNIKLKSAKYYDWVIDEENTAKDHFMRISTVNLIKECRKLAKSGVKFR